MSSPHSNLKKWLGRAFIACGLFLLVGVGCVIVPLVKLQDPSFNPHLSLKGYWEAKQTALKSGLLIYHDADMVGYFGDKTWAGKMVTWVQEGKKPFGNHGSLPEQGLPFLTNHDISEGEDPRMAWPLWWQQNGHLSQEQWLQAGFKKYGVEVSLPPLREDWPKLLTLLREAGMSADRAASLTMKRQIPYHVEYNSSRWLRDSGFSPELYLADRAPSQMTTDEEKGLLGYSLLERATRDTLQAPLPGRLAFAHPDWWGMVALDGGVHWPFFLSPVVQGTSALVGFSLLVGGWLMCRRKREPRASSAQGRSLLARRLGVLMMSGSLLLLAAFAWGGVILKAAAPENVAHRSPAGYWSDVQRALRIGHWSHDTTSAVAIYGNKEWVEKIMATVASGGEFEDCDGHHRDEALAQITNHRFSDASDVRQAWLNWWAKNRDLTQEQWIQAGFKAHSFDIAMPPTEKDWPTLLHILGRSVGPKPRPGSPVTLFYPDHLVFNAYRCLRDSGFDSVRYTVEHPLESLSVEESGGLFIYREHLNGAQYLAGPQPGELSFSPTERWRYWNGRWRPWLMEWYSQVIFSAICLGFGWWGWRLFRSKRYPLVN